MEAVSRGERTDRPSLASLRHSLILAEVRLMYEIKGAKWTCERALRSDFSDHLPDGLATFPDGNEVLIELELIAKESNRLRNIMITNLESGNYLINYWAGAYNLSPFSLELWLLNLALDLKIKMSVSMTHYQRFSCQVSSKRY